MPRFTWLLLALAAAGGAVAGFTGHLPGWGLSASLTVEGEPALAPGEQVNVTYRVRNLAPVPYTYEHPGCPGAVADLEVRGPDGAIPLYRYREEVVGSACAIRDVRLYPGQSVEATVDWNGYDTAQRPDPHGGDPVPPDEYTVVGTLSRADDGPVLERTAEVQVTG